jgi:allantoin racemase
MRILVANVNTTQSMTDSIAAQARSIAAPGTEIVGITPRFGADSCEGNFESYLAAIAVMDRVVSYPEPFDAVIQAGYGEHGREGLQELLDVPVVDITEAAASTAMFLGHKYSVVTTLDRAVPLIEDRLKLAGLDARCASVRASGMAVLELEEEPERAVEAIISQALLAVREDKAEVIVLGCGGMAGLDEQIRQRAGVPVVDGVAAAVTIAESLVRMQLSTSKVRTYATPRPKTVIGWRTGIRTRLRCRAMSPCPTTLNAFSLQSSGAGAGWTSCSTTPASSARRRRWTRSASQTGKPPWP